MRTSSPAMTIRCVGLGASLLAAAAFAAPTAPAAGAALVEPLAKSLGADYLRQQRERLLAKGDRDSLVAAILLGLPASTAAWTVRAPELDRLVAAHPDDAIALFAAALACQEQPGCNNPAYQASLAKLEPGNALSHLLLPASAPPDRERLKKAAAAGSADSHLSTLMGIVRSALAGQPAPTGAARAVDEEQLALALRRNAVDAVPWPKLGPTLGLCNADVAGQAAEKSLRRDCAKLGEALLADRGHSLVTRMFGGTLVRRFDKGGAPAAEALAMRRQYVWISELPEMTDPAVKERYLEESVMLGEWEAMLREAERQGASREPADNWTPKNPEFILLPEERAPPVKPKG